MARKVEALRKSVNYQGGKMSSTDNIYEIVQLFKQLDNQEAKFEVIKILEKIAEGKEWKQ